MVDAAKVELAVASGENGGRTAADCCCAGSFTVAKVSAAMDGMNVRR